MAEQMLQTKKIEGLGVLAGGVAHVCNNLLMGVMGNAELVLMQLPGDSSLRTQLAELQEFCRHAEDIVAVVLDMTMPELSGEEAYREIRKLDPRVPVLLSSGYPREMADTRCYERGPAGFIQKPYRPQHLVNCIREIAKR